MPSFCEWLSLGKTSVAVSLALGQVSNYVISHLLSALQPAHGRVGDGRLTPYCSDWIWIRRHGQRPLPLWRLQQSLKGTLFLTLHSPLEVSFCQGVHPYTFLPTILSTHLLSYFRALNF